MKRLCLKNQEATKRGVASLYVVIFATILFGVVTLSFMRIILSEAGSSSDSDLSRSAYDAAMAGVEDAKTAVNRYYSCLNGTGTPGQCTSDDYKAIFKEDCTDGIGIANYLYGDHYNGVGDDVPTEVKIQESSTTSEDNNADQAYTCVILNDTVPDYRGTLTSDTRTKVVPLSVYNENGNNSSRISEANTIRFRWYSALNQGQMTDLKDADDKELAKKGDATIPPTISVTLIRVKSGFKIEDFNTPNGNGNDTYYYSTMVLLPSKNGQNARNIPSSEIIEAGNVSAGTNEPKEVKCAINNEFACEVQFTGLNFAASDTVLLVVSLPYGSEATDFAAELKDGATTIPLTGVQVSVDSTGRTNQLLRRVETRLDPTDLFFPYPQYELELTGGSDSELKKNFWITANCWSSSPTKDAGNGLGYAAQCVNNGEVRGNTGP